ncbi:ribonuclease Z [Anaerobacillus sp. MEB173]|uniref:ribonuclease Z n=1 Tax=Anaerobacillus sp. MEB173 TaxID=3383345 RepID=UPI003F908F65
MELHFLGTGAGVPSTKRNVSAIALRFLQNNGRTWLFDCGEATQQQILRSPIKLSKMDRIFITHLHGDHIFGLPGLLGSRSFQGGESPLHIYGPKGLKDFITCSITVSGTHIKYSLHIHEIEEGTIIDTDHYTVKAYKLDHGLESFGYRIVERDQPGQLDVKRLQEIGISPGPIYKQIKNGETIHLENGQCIDGNDFIGQPKKGRVIAIAGDTRPTEASHLLAQNADVFVHEATFSMEEEELAYTYYHSTTKQAATIAFEANAAALILTHISARYEGREDQLLSEARETFQNTSIAKDYFVYPIPRRETK